MANLNPITIAKFLGMGTRWASEKVPPGMLIRGRNIRLLEDRLGPRPGLSVAIRVPFTVAPLVIVTTCPLPAGTSGVAYQTSLGASGGTAPYTWSISQGALPTGLSLGASTGAITGTPSVTGTFLIEITVTDGTRTDSKSCSIVIS